MRKKESEEQNYEFYEDNYDEEYDDSEYIHTGGSIVKKLIGVLVLLGLLAALLYYGYYLYNSMLTPVDPNDDTPVYVTVEPGMLAKQVGEVLQDSGVVKNSLVFQSYVGRHSYGGAEIQAATYEFTPSMSVKEIYTKLVNGDSYVGSLNSITIPEGLNITEISQLVEQAGICTADEYIAEASDLPKYMAMYPILSSIPEDQVPQRTLEGYLFPATYMIAIDGSTDANQLIMNQLDKFTEEYNEQLLQETQAAGRTVDDIVKLASIVELETKLPEDRPLAASVFYNRMAQGMPLQSDITIDYIYGTRTEILTTEQTQVESPYNTYINLGLPLGPICNPGIDSIIAAIEPAETDYLYFVADLNTGKLYFNTTLEEHDQDVEQLLN